MRLHRKFVSWRRVSTNKQGKSGLGLAKKDNAFFIIAKTDRFRNCREALEIYEEMNGKIIFCDLPYTEKFTLTLFFALAECEALLTSIRTKQVLAVKRAQGVRLGRPKGTSLEEANQASSIRLREQAQNNPTNKAVWAVCCECTNNHTARTNEAFMKAMNMLIQMGVKTQKGLDWNLERLRSNYYNLRRIYGLGSVKGRKEEE